MLASIGIRLGTNLICFTNIIITSRRLTSEYIRRGKGLFFLYSCLPTTLMGPSARPARRFSSELEKRIVFVANLLER